MNTKNYIPSSERTRHHACARLLHLGALLSLLFVFTVPTFGQTAGGTQIQNRASATYSDGSGNNYSTVSNTVTVTVLNVSGLIITPDSGTTSNAVAGQTARFTFTVTNTGNFADQVRFLANDASYRVTGAATITQAFIERGVLNGTYEAGTDIQLFNVSSDVISPSLAQNEAMTVVIVAQVNASAATGSTVSVRLGDAASDNVAADTSANEVRTVSASPVSVNGVREAVGDVSLTIEDDAQLLLTLTAPAGPVALNSTINYSLQLCNPGSRTAQGITLGGVTGVFIIAPIPVGTELAAAPAGSVLYSTSPLTVAPTAAAWMVAPPADLATVRRVAFNTGATLVFGASPCAPAVSFSARITTTNATTPIYEIADAFANNFVGNSITDQSGDTVVNGGDGNADFEENDLPGNQGPQFDGVQQRTLLQMTGSLVLGPSTKPAAVGPTSNNDDYTNRSVANGIAGVAPGGTTTALDTVTFTNTVRNDGNADDTIVFTAPTVPAGFTVEISVNGGTSYTTVAPGGGTASLLVPFGGSRDILVRVTAPAGLQVLQGYDTIIRAASTSTPAVTNNTINRLYTGFLRLDKTATVINDPVRTGAGGATDAVPGADIEFAITYTNVSEGGGSDDNVKLTASSIRITENGNAAPNTWGATTDQLVGSASDTRGGTIAGDIAGSVSLTDDVPALGAGQSGTFRFRRRIR